VWHKDGGAVTLQSLSEQAQAQSSLSATELLPLSLHALMKHPTFINNPSSIFEKVAEQEQRDHILDHTYIAKKHGQDIKRVSSKHEDNLTASEEKTSNQEINQELENFITNIRSGNLNEVQGAIQKNKHLINLHHLYITQLGVEGKVPLTT
jgi:hypothetical protein